MHAEDLVIDDGREREVVEDLRAVAPHIHRAVLPETLVVEAVHLRDLSRLVVPANKRDSIGVTNLQARI